MNRITDVILSTQLCTFFAAVCTYCAHMIERGSWLNPNWGFAVYLLLGCGTVFMLLPHLICHPKEQSSHIPDNTHPDGPF